VKTALPRLRQVALVAADLAATSAVIERELGARDPFADPGVGEFGLVNAVYELGDTFLEVVSPAADGTTAGRYLRRRGGDAGYMAIFQVADTVATRGRVATLGVRVVWHADLPDISGPHLHPQDVHGAIVSFDTPEPPNSWRWAGPRWTGAAPTDASSAGRITGLVVRVTDVDAAAAVWADVLDVAVIDRTITLEGGTQHVRFEPATDAHDEGIVAVELTGFSRTASIAGVEFRGLS
jgi:hypothetical protein